MQFRLLAPLITRSGANKQAAWGPPGAPMRFVRLGWTVNFADPTHITFGSDFPYVPASFREFTAALDAYPLDEKQRYAINRGNAERLFPRLATA
jgi:predicted TIM-barrel fold metal-dependent hydrolase